MFVKLFLKIVIKKLKIIKKYFYKNIYFSIFKNKKQNVIFWLLNVFSCFFFLKNKKLF